jgi:hypothetical protein
VRIWAKIGLKDGFEDQFQRSLYDAIANTGNLKPTGFAVALGNLDHPIWLRLVGAGQQVGPYCRQKALHALGLNVRKGLSIETWSPTVMFCVVVRLC